jgi:hypothetical protein
MAYIGRDIEQGLFTKQTFTADSSTTVFTLSHAVVSANNLLVSVGGVIQEPDSAYTASGTVLTFTGIPTTGDLIWVVYLGKSGSSATTRGAIVKQTGVGDGTTTPITLSTSAVNSASIIVTLNGVVQVPDTDFVASGTTLTFTTAPSAALAILVYFLSGKARLGKPAAGSVTAATLASSGTLPAVNGSALTGVLSHADLNVLRTNIALAGFNRSTDHATTVLGMPSGFIDQFQDQTGVDDPSSTYETYGVTSVGHSKTMTRSSGGWAVGGAYTIRNLIPSSQIAKSGSRVTVTVQSGTSIGEYIKVYIGHASVGGNAWDFDGQQKQVFFSGSASVEVPAGQNSVVSDQLVFDLDSTKDLIVSFQTSADTSKDDYTDSVGQAAHVGVGYSYYYIQTTDTVGDTAPSSYFTTTTHNVGIIGIGVEGKYYINQIDTVNTTDSLPDMTANNSPSGTALASTENAASNAAWIAMSNDSANSWVTTTPNTTGFLQFGFNNGQTAKIIKKYIIEGQTGQPTRAPRDWTFKGSNDGTTFTTLDTQTNQYFSSGERKTYNNFTNTTSYVFYRLDITANNGSTSVSIQEFELYEADTYYNMTIISETSTASASPDNAHIALFNEEVDALTLDTDIMAWASRSKQTFTATNASNVLNTTAHGLSNGDRVMLTGSTQVAGNMIPVMGSLTSPSGTVSANGELSGNEAWRAFDSNTSGTLWNVNTNTGYLQFAFNNGLTAKVIAAYDLWNFTTAAAPVNWTIQASNTGAFGGEQVTLHTVTGASWGTANELKQYTFSNTTSYIFYRMNITLNGGGADTAIASLQLIVANEYSNLPTGLTSEPVYYVVNKTTNTFKVSLTSGGAAVALTDDGTETHSVRVVTKASLVDRGDFETGKATLSALVDISGQPTDTDMSLIVQTKNNKETKLHGMSMQYT